jgi:hypothetical protein
MSFILRIFFNFQSAMIYSLIFIFELKNIVYHQRNEMKCLFKEEIFLTLHKSEKQTQLFFLKILWLVNDN